MRMGIAHSFNWFCRIVLFLCCFSGIWMNGLCQLSFDVNVSEKHLKKVDRAKDARSKLSAYKKLYSKDSLKAAKKAWKTYKKEHKDSLKQVGRWREAKLKQREILLGEWPPETKKYDLDTLNWPAPRDSLDWAMQELAKRGEFTEIQIIYEAYGQYDSMHWEQYKPDSLNIDSLDLVERFQMKERLQKYLPEELKQESDYTIDQQLQHGAIDEFGNVQSIDRSGVADFFKNVDPKEFSKSQVSLAAAKEKFVELPDLSKEEEGIKRNSLKGEPLKNRIFLNGNVALQSTDPIIIDLNIQLGYRWTKKLSSGIGVILREQFSNDSDSTSSITGDSHGLSFFTNYDIAKGFFLYGEFQAVNSRSLFAESSQASSWEYAVLAGIGRRFQISSKISLSVSLLYDLNYRNNTLNRRPLTPRIGYNISF